MESTTAPPGAATHKTLADIELDRKISDRLQMINRALAARDDALKAVTKCEKSAVISGWRLGQFLIEKKRRLGHGQWLPWLSTVGLGERQARRYLRLAEIGLESDLDDSITKILDRLDSAARDDAALARSLWRTWLDETPPDSPAYHAIVQAVPDGPFTGKRWLNFFDEIAAAETDEELRAAYEHRPWAAP